MPLYASEGTWFAAEEVAKRELAAGLALLRAGRHHAVEPTADNSPLACLRRVYARNDRQGLDLRRAFDLANEYHYHVGALLKERPARSEAQVATELANYLERNGFR
jgi:hypothetical protein